MEIGVENIIDIWHYVILNVSFNLEFQLLFYKQKFNGFMSDIQTSTTYFL